MIANLMVLVRAWSSNLPYSANFKCGHNSVVESQSSKLLVGRSIRPVRSKTTSIRLRKDACLSSRRTGVQIPYAGPKKYAGMREWPKRPDFESEVCESSARSNRAPGARIV